MSEVAPVLSKDAVIFAFGHLRGPKASLSFGGEGARMRITDRARAALDELIAAGYVEPAEPTSSITGREYYRGVTRDPHVGQLARDIGFNPFKETGDNFTTFEKIPEAEAPAPGM